MWRISRITPAYLQQQRGFSLGIEDVRPSRSLWLEKKSLVDQGCVSRLCADYVKVLFDRKRGVRKSHGASTKWKNDSNARSNYVADT